jgi:hypothetical protein
VSGLLALSAAAPASAAEKGFADLTGGKYELRVDGLVCHTCLKLAVEEISSLKVVSKAAGDFDAETIWITLKPNTTLKASKLEKALHKASKRADLATQFDLVSVKYKVK